MIEFFFSSFQVTLISLIVLYCLVLIGLLIVFLIVAIVAVSLPVRFRRYIEPVLDWIGLILNFLLFRRF